MINSNNTPCFDNPSISSYSTIIPSTSSSHQIPQRHQMSNRNNALPSFNNSAISGNNKEIQQLKINQNTMWNVIEECLEVVKRIESKVDILINQTSMPEQQINNEDTEIITSLPVGIDGFLKLDERIAGNSALRQRLVKILKTIGRKDPKALVNNILRRLIVDDVGEKFSLTGKRSLIGMVKEPFENTTVYQLVLGEFLEFKLHVSTTKNDIEGACISLKTWKT